VSDNQIMMIIGGAVALGVIAVIAYYVAAYLKGSIKIELPETSFKPGDTLKGSFSLLARKPIEGNRLFVSLVADEIRERREDGETKRETREIYRDEKTIEGKKAYAAGFNENFAFEIDVPSTAGSGVASVNSELGKVVNLLGDVFDMNTRKTEWKVEVRLDAAGVDLTDSEDVYINWK